MPTKYSLNSGRYLRPIKKKTKMQSGLILGMYKHTLQYPK